MAAFVFVDSRVADYQDLVAGLPPGTEVVVLGAERDGVAQIAAALAGATDLDSIHILSHGSSGTLYLGSTVDSRVADYADLLAGLPADPGVVVLEAVRDGVAHVAAALAGVTDLDAIHYLERGGKAGGALWRS